MSNQQKYRVLLIDVGGTWYFEMFTKYLKKRVNLTIITSCETNIENAKKYFYKFSRKINNRKIKKIVKGFEYIIGYMKVIKFIKNNKFEIVHIRWSIVPRIDVFFQKKIKKYVGKLFYTADDVIPHVSSNKLMKIYGQLYTIPDTIIVHGEFCKKELIHFFKVDEKRIYIQKHGVHEKCHCQVSREIIEKHNDMIRMVKSKKLVIGCIGQINEYKGIDLLIEAWIRFVKENSDTVLIIAGRTIDTYASSFKKIKGTINNSKNVYFFNDFFSYEEEKLFYLNCDLIVLPYKTASMSGVLFSAARYDKTILATLVGCLPQYLLEGKHISYLCEPKAEAIIEKLKEIVSLDNCKNVLMKNGEKFSEMIYRTCSWEKIINNLLQECYKI